MRRLILLSKLRSRLLYKIDWGADKIGMYTSYEVQANELVGSTDRDIKDVITRLREIGYKYNSISAAKQHAESGNLETASFRSVPEEHPDLNQETQITSNWRPIDCQYHVHLFEVDDRVEITSHYELRPDILNPEFSSDRLRTHYRPEWGESYIPGVYEPSVENIIKDS